MHSIHCGWLAIIMIYTQLHIHDHSCRFMKGGHTYNPIKSGATAEEDVLSKSVHFHTTKTEVHNFFVLLTYAAWFHFHRSTLDFTVPTMATPNSQNHSFLITIWVCIIRSLNLAGALSYAEVYKVLHDSVFCFRTIYRCQLDFSSVLNKNGKISLTDEKLLAVLHVRLRIYVI